MSFQLIVVLIIVLLIVCHCVTRPRYRCVISAFDGNNYSVVDTKVEELDRASADMLARIDKFISELIEYMRVKYIVKGYVDDCFDGALLTNRLISTYNREAVKENFPTDLKFTSYVINKGEEIAFCLHPKGQPLVFHDFNTIQFVVLHELGHLANATLGHPRDFWRGFAFLEQNAIEAGLYKPIDYHLKPVEYCGVNVTYNPVFDKDLTTC